MAEEWNPFNTSFVGFKNDRVGFKSDLITPESKERQREAVESLTPYSLSPSMEQEPEIISDQEFEKLIKSEPSWRTSDDPKGIEIRKDFSSAPKNSLLKNTGASNKQKYDNSAGSEFDPTELENRISALEGKVSALEGKVSALESKVEALEDWKDGLGNLTLDYCDGSDNKSATFIVVTP